MKKLAENINWYGKLVSHMSQKANKFPNLTHKIYHQSENCHQSHRVK